jgi:hypothetical protein
MAVPTPEAFVYCWTNTQNNRIYVGVHKGTPNDGYVCSSKVLLKEYKQSPQQFTRQIIATGTLSNMRALESAILQSVNAANNPHYYNQHNNNGTFFCDGHSEETRKKMSTSWKRRGTYNCNHDKAIASWIGKTHKEESKHRMKEAAKKHTATRSSAMVLNNPMKNIENIEKMLKTRKINKELRYGRTS